MIVDTGKAVGVIGIVGAAVDCIIGGRVGDDSMAVTGTGSS